MPINSSSLSLSPLVARLDAYKNKGISHDTNMIVDGLNFSVSGTSLNVTAGSVLLDGRYCELALSDLNGGSWTQSQLGNSGSIIVLIDTTQQNSFTGTVQSSNYAFVNNQVSVVVGNMSNYASNQNNDINVDGGAIKAYSICDYQVINGTLVFSPLLSTVLEGVNHARRTSFIDTGSITYTSSRAILQAGPRWVANGDLIVVLNDATISIQNISFELVESVCEITNNLNSTLNLNFLFTGGTFDVLLHQITLQANETRTVRFNFGTLASGVNLMGGAGRSGQFAITTSATTVNYTVSNLSMERNIF